MKPSSSVPKFLTKIWALVEDPRTNDYICWSQDGNSFIVLDEESFAKEILPKNFKHNNMASFVRQLNWYGFHKVVHDESGVAKQEYGQGKYQHLCFKRGQEELLTKIKRKVPVPRIEEGKMGPEDMHKILAFLHQVQGRQDVMDSTVESLKRENETLWKEVLDLRQKHLLHQQRFESVAPSQSYDRITNLQANQPLMIDSTGNYNQLSVHKTSQNIDQMFGNKSLWTTNGKATRRAKRAYTVQEDHLESSTEESSNPVMSITVPQVYERYEPDDSDNPTDFSSSETEEMANADIASSSMCSKNPAPGLSPSFAKLPENVKTQHRAQVPNKRLKKSTERHFSPQEAEYRMNSSGSDDTDECKAFYKDSGHAKKSQKVSRSTCFKMEHMLKQMHRDNTGLTKRVLAVEKESCQKLSEISGVLSTLANFIMNKQDLQRQLLPPSLDMEGTTTQQNESQTSQSYQPGMWSEKTAYYPAKKNHES
ncbi:uncharacterized protein LOC142493334 isoform X1 [Ascaphus truei]|uniref:uncharacterized protein LOC142493334 isoform X1 n=1 Tax=Ascaphus truei TaxID=8439 RepID=UPI003F5932BE